MTGLETIVEQILQKRRRKLKRSKLRLPETRIPSLQMPKRLWIR